MNHQKHWTDNRSCAHQNCLYGMYLESQNYKIIIPIRKIGMQCMFRQQNSKYQYGVLLIWSRNQIRTHWGCSSLLTEYQTASEGFTICSIGYHTRVLSYYPRVLLLRYARLAYSHQSQLFMVWLTSLISYVGVQSCDQHPTVQQVLSPPN